MLKVMGTGPRSLVVASKETRKEVYDITERFILVLREEYGEILIISGLAEGWDEMIAKIAQRNNIPYDAYIPNPGYGAYYWRDHSKLGRDRFTTFKELVKGARQYYVVCNSVYQNGVHCNFVRNTAMVDACDIGIVYNPSSSGTRDGVAKLRQANKPYEIYPFTKQLTLL
ncbi:MAG: hypothetical protein ACWGQW_02830 [bacterium]